MDLLAFWINEYLGSRDHFPPAAPAAHTIAAVTESRSGAIGGSCYEVLSTLLWRPPLAAGADKEIYLPAPRSSTGRRGKRFFARVRGQTLAYPFLPAVDLITIEPAPESGILRSLLDSNFTGREWTVREDATHAKSKTSKRADARI